MHDGQTANRRADAAQAAGAEGDLWVFGYGSLLWRPGFAYAERRIARIHGYRRAFCLRSVRYRGTPRAPGLVLALDRAPGAWCDGAAFRVPAESAAEAHAYLNHREMDEDSYLETFHEIELRDGGRVRALCYLMNQAHPHYAPLPLDEQARIIAASVGPAGPNAEYLHNTVAHLRELGLRDPELERLDEMVRALSGARQGA
ncbi:gamma-glutamylcyclotransferase [Oceanicella actignis]|uniref:glutathione-specific gamma-glutamylcyclotransferase n=1 Tax=Oceanicella actignis TaxID=1189325 RepID=A0A1M7SHL9_9RHOB|nr:gamma-glutamylcyclotransferase [Oceanicella actignis]TYO91204.1 cation transport protein ChaC [Oceanicella actignis]SET19113.1 cation transport protein ChaC [Oceanicella actignis]SHN57978.1 cation transport protein ChaC [Oceanicella actignis]